jgi:predicted small secreted protein
MRLIKLLFLPAAAVFFLAACSTTQSVGDVPAAVEAAKSAADHSRLAEYFDAKAKVYEAEAAEHARLAAGYASAAGYGGSAPVDARPRAPYEDPRFGIYRRTQSELAQHCRELQGLFSKSAKEARALAQAHRDLAASAPR